MYRRLSNLRLTQLMSRSITNKRPDDEASAGWTTYGTSRAAFSFISGHHHKSLEITARLSTSGEIWQIEGENPN
jgi:hypothetical protein